MTGRRLGSFASENATLSVLLIDGQQARKWCGAAESAEELSDALGPVVSDEVASAMVEHAGAKGLVLRLEGESGYADVYDAGKSRLLVIEPSASYFDENRDDFEDVPDDEDAIATALGRLAQQEAPDEAEDGGTLEVAGGTLHITDVYTDLREKDADAVVVAKAAKKYRIKTFALELPWGPTAVAALLTPVG
jgi:hypothetical protein